MKIVDALATFERIDYHPPFTCTIRWEIEIPPTGGVIVRGVVDVPQARWTAPPTEYDPDGNSVTFSLRPHTSVTIDREFDPTEFAWMGPEALIESCYGAVRMHVLHEVQEWFRVDGELYDDPHLAGLAGFAAWLRTRRSAS